MAEPFKNFFNKEVIENIANAILIEKKDFNKTQFIESVINIDWENKELKERMKHISLSLKQTINLPYLESLKILYKIAPKINNWGVIAFIDFIESNGLEYFEQSVSALKYLTQFSSSEFGVRPYIINYPKKMMKEMLKWSKDKNYHVRRLASEGCRPRLPWAMALPEFKKDPSLIMPILENLKNDESEYVRKSVANNLNDISKDNPQLVLKLIKDWKGKSKNTDWILKHGSRTLLKSGNPEALEIFGLSYKVNVDVLDLKASKKEINIGDNIEFTFIVYSKEKKDIKLRLEYFIYYVKSKGRQSKKIFKISEINYPPFIKKSIKRKHSFKNNSIRKHYPGKHKISIVCNGIEKSFIEFILN